ncbi:MAG: hypothetical protein H3C62_18450, partial [Gemmatimonadaceae bacterium]|nr:hypothetical protein [Gemmatimonadaceae bacterium]
MTAPAVPATETIRAARATVAADITRSRRRIADLSAQLRAETQQLANLTAIAEVVGVTAVDVEGESNVVVDPSASAVVAAGGASLPFSTLRGARRQETETPSAGTP